MKVPKELFEGLESLKIMTIQLFQGLCQCILPFLHTRKKFWFGKFPVFEWLHLWLKLVDLNIGLFCLHNQVWLLLHIFWYQNHWLLFTLRANWNIYRVGTFNWYFWNCGPFSFMTWNHNACNAFILDVKVSFWTLVMNTCLRKSLFDRWSIYKGFCSC